MKKGTRVRQERQFCRTYLQTMDPERAALTAELPDGFAAMEKKNLRQTLEQMRETAAEQIRREDVIRQLARLAFGGANDPLKLADPEERQRLETLDLSAVSEFKVTEKGVEVKLVDRVRALETLFRLLEETEQERPSALYQALTEAVEEGGWDNG